MRDPAIGEILVQPDDLRRKVAELGREISADYADRDLLLVGVLKGAVFFLSDLMREISVPCEVDFMAVASYGSATDSSGVVRILKDLDASIEGRHVLIVEDIRHRLRARPRRAVSQPALRRRAHRRNRVVPRCGPRSVLPRRVRMTPPDLGISPWYC